MPRDLPAVHSASWQSPILFFSVALVAAAVVAGTGWTTARGLETCWDERVDLDIAAGLRQDPWFGERPTLDGSQTRLPMYLTALAFQITGRESLGVARGTSLLLSIVTVVAASLLAKRLFGTAAGLLTAGLLACSPYFIAYSRIAMTEGDAAFTCLMVLSLGAFVEYQRRPTAARWLIVGVLAGLTLGAKLYGVVLLPAWALLEWRSNRLSPESSGQQPGRRTAAYALAAGWLLAASGAAAALAAHQARLAQATDRVPAWEAVALGCWALLLLAWMTFVVLTVRQQQPPPAAIWRRMAGLTLLAGLTFFAVMPVHLVQHEIAREVVRLLLGGDRSPPPISLSDRASLYLGIILHKYPVQLGLVTGIAVVWGAVRAWRDAAWRICTLPIVLYIGLLLLLPLRQTFYLMPVYPLLMIATAAALVRAGSRMRRLGQVRTLLALAFTGWTAWQHGGDLRHVWPCLHLYGINRVDGSRMGYRNLIQTPSDGVESLIHWCNLPGHVPPGSRVASFLWEQHIIARMLPAEPHYVFIPRGITAGGAAHRPPPPPWKEADFVLLHVNNLVGYGDWPPDGPTRASLVSAGFRPVFTVSRGPLEVAWVWSRERQTPETAE